MSNRRPLSWLAGCGWAASAGLGLAQSADPAPVVPLTPVSTTSTPLLLPVPEATPADTGPKCATPANTGPKVEYDESLLYLPDSIPKSSPPHRPVAPDPETLRVWASGGAFLGWSSPQTGGPRLASADNHAGRSLFGDKLSDAPFRAGLRLDGGVWLNEPRTFGVEAGGLFLPQAGGSTLLAAGGPTSLLVPVNDGTTGLFPLAGPDRTGVFVADWNSRFVSADVDVWRELFRGDHLRVAGTAGYRFGRLGEDLTVRSNTVSAIGGPVRFLDVAETTNVFHGGQLGLSGGLRSDRWAFDLTGEVAVGALFRTAELSGATAVGGVATDGGFFARPGTQGERSETRFGVLPTLTAAVSRQVTDHGKLFVGYTLHYLSDVIRPGPVLGPAGDPGGSGLALSRGLSNDDFWVQGVNLGMEWEY